MRVWDDEDDDDSGDGEEEEDDDLLPVDVKPVQTYVEIRLVLTQS